MPHTRGPGETPRTWSSAVRRVPKTAFERSTTVKIHALLAAVVAALVSAGAAQAAEVKVEGIHNCCPGCTKNITATLEAGGAKEIKLEGRSLSFQADDAQKTVVALFDAGYAGMVTGATAPRMGVPRDTKGTTFKLAGAHLCCGACVKSVNEAVKEIGTTDAKGGAKEFTVTAKSEVEARAVIRALRMAGFNAKLVK